MGDNDESIQVVSLKDDKAKMLAMEMANDKGRMVLESIFEGRKSSSEIAKELGIGLSTVLFHIERLKEAGIIRITDTELSKKFREIKYYGPSSKAILIVPGPEQTGIGLLSLPNKVFSKTAGISALLGASLAGAFIGLFSKTSHPVVDTGTDSFILDAQNVPEAIVRVGEGAGGMETVRVLPSLPQIAVLVAVAVCMAFLLVQGYYYFREKKEDNPPESEKE